MFAICDCNKLMPDIRRVKTMKFTDFLDCYIFALLGVSTYCLISGTNMSVLDAFKTGLPIAIILFILYSLIKKCAK